MSKYGAPTDFNFGANVEPAASDFKTRDPPTYACTGRVACATCGKFFGYHDAVPDLLQEIQALKDLVRDGLSYDLLEIDYPPRPFQLIPEAWERGKPKLEWSNEPMDLKSQRSTTGPSKKFENREWIDPQVDLPKKGSVKWRIDAFREAKNKKRGIIGFIDITAGKKKRVMSLRKGFTLDAIMDELGTKTEKWVGKSLALCRGGNEGQYVNVA